MTYTCKICGTTSEASEFYASINNRCKDCHKAKVRENRAAKAEYYKQYDAKRFQNDPRVIARHKRYQKTKSGKASMKKARKKWLAENQIKRAAHIILGNAVRSGRITKPDVCVNCNSGGRIHGHHTDYSKPLDVVWLCPSCHYQEHNAP